MGSSKLRLNRSKSRFNRDEIAIIKTLLYSDIFDFPLSKDELWQFLISRENILRDSFEYALKNLSGDISCKDGFYCLKSKEWCIKKRKAMLPEARKKLKIAKKAAYNLSYIPTVKFIGISGGLAAGNAEKTDDIDFFIITKKNTLFMTRLWVLAVLELMNLRRTRTGKNASNKICVNLLIDETRLKFHKHDLYTAREIVQVKPLFEREDTYNTFLNKNKWVSNFFPNMTKQQLYSGKRSKNYNSLNALSNLLHLPPLPQLAKAIQIIYMKKHQTSEVISSHILAFHPNDYRPQTLKLLSKKLQQFGLLTKG